MKVGPKVDPLKSGKRKKNGRNEPEPRHSDFKWSISTFISGTVCWVRIRFCKADATMRCLSPRLPKEILFSKEVTLCHEVKARAIAEGTPKISLKIRTQCAGATRLYRGAGGRSVSAETSSNQQRPKNRKKSAF